MISRSFTVVDETHISAAPILQEMCNEIDSAISDYVSILAQVTLEAAKAGNTTERYLQYSEMISGLRGQFSTLGTTLSSAAKTFVAEIDDADSYLY